MPLPIAPLAGACMGLGWFVAVGGAMALDPTDLSWIQGDHAQHVFGWLFFRNEPWRFPLGTIHNLGYPLGTTLGFTDANPLVSVLLKPVSPWLPREFQFIGPWLAACFVLQGVFGARILETLTTSVWQQLCGAAMFVLAPPLLVRIGHDTLSAQWLLLALIWLHLRTRTNLPGTIAWTYALSGFSAGVHPYLAAMVVALSVALWIRMALERTVDWWTAAIASAGLVIEVVAIFALFGYIGSSTDLTTGGFGLYSADLLTFVNPVNYSRWMPNLPMGEGQYEGFGYLGLGMMGLAAGVIGASLLRRRMPVVPSRAWPLVICGALMGVFALSNHVTVGGYEILTMRKFYETFDTAVGPLRASGRFIWPPYYILVTGILAAVVGRHLAVNARVVTVCLVAAVAIQVAEVRPDAGMVDANRTGLESPDWQGLGARYRHLVFYPPYYADRPPDYCTASPFTFADTTKFLDLAYRELMTINSAYLARTSMSALGVYCEQLRREINAGVLRPNAVYIVTEETVRQFRSAEVDAVCGRLDGFNVCVRSDSSEDFREALIRSRER